jgi:hypothetical protein
MDIYYRALAFIATMRNWTNEPAFDVSRFLYFYRLIGVTAFELTHLRPLLLIFPNTFEYFFITYEGIRSRWDPRRFGMRFWVWTAAVIWIFIKLPQEYWVHIAKLDFTDTVADVPWFAPTLAVLAIAGGILLWTVVRPKLRPADWTWRFAADRLPAERDIGAARDAWTAAHGRVLNSATIEKLLLGGLIIVIFGQIMPDSRVSNVQLFLGAAALVVVDAAMSLALARRHRSVKSLVAALGLRAVVNIGLVVILSLPLRSGELNRVPLVFFVLLLTLITGLYDRYRPVRAARPAQRPELFRADDLVAVDR